VHEQIKLQHQARAIEADYEKQGLIRRAHQRIDELFGGFNGE
jgi:hypothetical protein